MRLLFLLAAATLAASPALALTLEQANEKADQDAQALKSMHLLVLGDFQFGTSQRITTEHVETVVDGKRSVRTSTESAHGVGEGFEMMTSNSIYLAAWSPQQARTVSVSTNDTAIYQDNRRGEDGRWEMHYQKPGQKPIILRGSPSQAFDPVSYTTLLRVALGAVEPAQWQPDADGMVNVPLGDNGEEGLIVFEVRGDAVLLHSRLFGDAADSESQTYSGFVQVEGLWLPTQAEHRKHYDGILAVHRVDSDVAYEVLSEEELAAFMERPASEIVAELAPPPAPAGE